MLCPLYDHSLFAERTCSTNTHNGHIHGAVIAIVISFLILMASTEYTCQVYIATGTYIFPSPRCHRGALRYLQYASSVRDDGAINLYFKCPVAYCALSSA